MGQTGSKMTDAMIGALIVHAFYMGGEHGTSAAVIASIIACENPGTLKSTDEQFQDAKARYLRVLGDLKGLDVSGFRRALAAADAARPGRG